MSKIAVLPSDTHWYESPTKPGVYYPSVTTVNVMPKGAHFDKYLADMESYEKSQEVLRELGARGTRVHKLTEILENGGSVDYYEAQQLHGITPEEFELVQFYVDWRKSFTGELIACELGLVSDTLELGGTVDRIYKVDGKLVLVDLKTSRNTIYPYHWTQVAAYASMYEELYKVKIAEVAILRVTKSRKGGYEYKTKKRIDWQKDLKQFKNNLATFKYLYGTPQPKLYTFDRVLTLS